MKYLLFLIVLSGIVSPVSAQVKGIVLGSDKDTQEPLFNVKEKLLNTDTGTSAHEPGQFELVLPEVLADTLVYMAIGFLSDTIGVAKADRFISVKVTLYSDEMLPEVVARYKKGTKSISRLKGLHVEEIG